MPEPLFDMHIRTMRRERAMRHGPALFVYERLFDDCLERIAGFERDFGAALLIGAPGPSWALRLAAVADQIEESDEPANLPSRRYDLCVAIGTLDIVNHLPEALRQVRQSLNPGSLFIGTVPGGETLPKLRAAMRAADAIQGRATPHIHPRIEASALAPLLSSAGFVTPVVDVDRMRVSYPSLRKLVDDLRAMGATNILNSRSRVGITKAARAAANDRFAALGDGDRTEELFELLHFAAWTPQQG